MKIMVEAENGLEQLPRTLKWDTFSWVFFTLNKILPDYTIEIQLGLEGWKNKFLEINAEKSSWKIN